MVCVSPSYETVTTFTRSFPSAGEKGKSRASLELVSVTRSVCAQPTVRGNHMSRPRVLLLSIVHGLVAAFAAGNVMISLNDLWYKDLMNTLGDPAGGHPHYYEIAMFYWALPYIIGGAMVGFLSGFGPLGPWWRVLLRLAAGPMALYGMLQIWMYGKEPYVNEVYAVRAVGGFVAGVLAAIILSRATKAITAK